MKVVKNICEQSLNVPFISEGITKTLFITPGGRVEIPDSWLSSNVADTLKQRRMIKIINKPDSTVPAAPSIPEINAPIKKNNKWWQ